MILCNYEMYWLYFVFGIFHTLIESREETVVEYECLTTILVSRAVFSGIVTQYSACSHCGGWLCTLVMMTVRSTELLRLPPSVAMICWLIRDVCQDERQVI